MPSLRSDGYGEMFEPYGGARLQLYMFSTIPPDFPFPAETPVADDDDGNVLPEGVYIPHIRSVPPAESYRPNDAIRLFIDGARFLPDAVTVTRVTGRIFDRNYDQIGPDISTGIDLTSDIFHPSYNYTAEIKSLSISPTATLLLKVYTIDRFTGDPALIGWAAINLFVESCSLVAPKSDTGDFQVSLNEGAHQIRVYHLPPPTDQAFSVESLTSSGRVIPCATLLLRIMKAGTTTTTMERPEYSQGVYLSSTAHPTAGETQLYRAMGNRSMVRVREVIPLLAGSAAQGLVTDKLLSDWVNKTFSEIKEAPRPFQLCCVSPYLVTSGVKVSVDAAQNLPWLGFTFAHVCFNPPAAYYYGHPWMRYDRATTVHDIDLSSDQRCPVWQDGFMTFTRRIFHKHLTIIIHLHEIVTQESEVNVSGSEQTRPEVSSQGSVPVFRPASQAWTALGVFYKSYCNLGVYQLPLYQGAPSQVALRALRSGNCREKLQEMEDKNMVRKGPRAEEHGLLCGGWQVSGSICHCADRRWSTPGGGDNLQSAGCKPDVHTGERHRLVHRTAERQERSRARPRHAAARRFQEPPSELVPKVREVSFTSHQRSVLSTGPQSEPLTPLNSNHESAPISYCLLPILA
ncbi:uncharacterized protein [Dendrobates tinctorius]|uniref:uncharacterized protein isoform X3 n=1 Tax=Dendrobates tinctorius TaxID=92724 RepID=UPI003CCA0B26